MRRTITFILGMVLFLGGMLIPRLCMAEETASDDPILYRYSYISSINATLNISGSSAECYGRVTCASSSYDIAITMTLKRQSGSSWVTVVSWSGNGSLIATLNETVVLSVEGSYKVVVVGKIKNSSGTVLETATKESSIKTY